MKLKNKNILIIREKLDKSQLRDTEQHIWPVLLKTVKAIKNSQEGASLVAQWLRIRLPMQGTQVRALVQKIPHAAEQLSPCATTTEPAL